MEKRGFRQGFVMNVLGDFVIVRFIKDGEMTRSVRDERGRPVKGYLIAFAALALLAGMVFLKARAS